MHVDVRFDLEDNAEESSELQQRACDDWSATFNHERPHEALGMKVPGEVYHPSERRLSRYLIGGYPDGCEKVNVSTSGNIRYGDRKFFVSQGVAKQRVGLLRVNDIVQVWFFHLLLGSFPAERDGHFEPYLPDEDDLPTSNTDESDEADDSSSLSPDVTASASPA